MESFHNNQSRRENDGDERRENDDERRKRRENEKYELQMQYMEAVTVSLTINQSIKHTFFWQPLL